MCTYCEADLNQTDVDATARGYGPDNGFNPYGSGPVPIELREQDGTEE